MPKGSRTSKQRKPQNSPLLRTVLLLFVLLLYLPSQTGVTYGGFASYSDAAFHFQACPVFPSVIEGRLNEILTHFQNANAVRSQLQPLAVSAPTVTAPAAPLLIPTATNVTYSQDSFSGSSLFKLDTAAEDASLRIAFLQERITALSGMLASSAASFQVLANELASGSASLNDAIRLSRDIPANCARLSGSSVLAKLEVFTGKDTPLSSSHSASLAELIGYLRQLYEAGITVQNVPNSLTNQWDAAKENYPIPRDAAGGAVSRELLQDYEAVQRLLEAEIRDCMAELHVLHSGLSGIETD